MTSKSCESVDFLCGAGVGEWPLGRGGRRGWEWEESRVPSWKFYLSEHLYPATSLRNAYMDVCTLDSLFPNWFLIEDYLKY